MNPSAHPEASAEHPKRAALYARVSTDDKGQDPETQLVRLRDLAARKGWLVVGEYVDKGYSGAKERRPKLDALMAAVRAGEVDVVVVYRFDRFARSVRHLTSALDEFREHGVDFVSEAENIDTTTAVGEFTFTLIAAVAQLERTMIADRVKAGMARARRQGLRIGRKPKDIDLLPAITMLEAGHTLERTARSLKLPRRTLRRHLERAGKWPVSVIDRSEDAAPAARPK